MWRHSQANVKPIEAFFTNFLFAFKFLNRIIRVDLLSAKFGWLISETSATSFYFRYCKIRKKKNYKERCYFVIKGQAGCSIILKLPGRNVDLMQKQFKNIERQTRNLQRISIGITLACEYHYAMRRQ